MRDTDAQAVSVSREQRKVDTVLFADLVGFLALRVQAAVRFAPASSLGLDVLVYVEEISGIVLALNR